MEILFVVLVLAVRKFLEFITFHQLSHLLTLGAEVRMRDLGSSICVEKNAVNFVTEFCMAYLWEWGEKQLLPQRTHLPFPRHSSCSSEECSSRTEYFN
jgi:hypothetical protein